MPRNRRCGIEHQVYGFYTNLEKKKGSVCKVTKKKKMMEVEIVTKRQEVLNGESM